MFKLARISFFIYILIAWSFLLFAQNVHSITLWEALAQSLEANQVIKIEFQNIDEQAGIAQQASGQFDWVLTGQLSYEKNREQTSVPEIAQVEVTDLQVGMQKQFRTGIVITPSIELTKAVSNGLVALSTPNNPSSNLNVQILVPLLRGLGSRSVAAQELAANSQLNAVKYNTYQNITEAIVKVANAYWECVAAEEFLDILKDSILKTQEVIDAIKDLTTKGELPAYLLGQGFAELRKRESNVKSAELNLFKARLNLGLAIGYRENEILCAPASAKTFPAIPSSLKMSEQSKCDFIDYALNYRNDYLAILETIETNRILAYKAKNDNLPQLNFFGKFGFRGNAPRFLDSLSTNLVGLNSNVGLSFQQPIPNNLALGAFEQYRAATLKAEYTAERFSAIIASQVLSTFEEVQVYHNQIIINEPRGTYLEIVRDNVRTKVLSGEESLTSYIDIQDSLYQAQLDYVQSKLNYFVSLSNFRLATSTVIIDNVSEYRIDMNALITPPTN